MNNTSNTYEKRQATRRERYYTLAKDARNKSLELVNEASKKAKIVPLAQPILIDHYSAKRHQAHEAQLHSLMKKATEEEEKAEYYRQKAESVGKGGISSDDPEAIEKLKKQLQERKEKQEGMKAANRRERGSFARFELSNNLASIKRIEGRIKTLEAKKQAAQRPAKIITGQGWKIWVNWEDNRVWFQTEEKPSLETQNILKRWSFRWSPQRVAWVRQATGNGVFSAGQVVAALRKKEGGAA